MQLEMDPSVHNHYDYLGMVRKKSSNPNSGSSQFYINVANNTSSLDGRYTIFGKVVNGADAAVAISNIPVGDCK